MQLAEQSRRETALGGIVGGLPINLQLPQIGRYLGPRPHRDFGVLTEFADIERILELDQRRMRLGGDSVTDFPRAAGELGRRHP
ncbi:hypothetical protein [Nocardia blacklockiae]|uniref:hypothetical protein n=1 Tax=Nocardia blacklockiae TaxID=480036 RepID=UPI001E57C240|nr:hypothetical protein [Nocardia blacklockiae]